MESSRNNHLGINKLSRSIRKSPLHQPPYQQQQQPPPQPQVYNISKNDFRSIVQQLTGTPSRDPNPIPPAPAPPRPPHPKPSSLRLQRIRPPPLAPIARNPNPNPNPGPVPVPGPGFLPRPGWADSPVSAYMRYLETSLLHSDGSRPPGVLPSPRPQLPPSPSSYLNLLSPRSPHLLLSPGFQYPPPLTPNFSLSPLPSGQQGILGPGPGPLSPMPPLSPGLFFPSSPSGFFPLMSPRWRDM